MQYCFGVDVGGTTVKMGLFEETGKLLENWEIPTRTEENGSKILGDVADSINGKMKQKNLNQSEVIGIGMGVPGPVIDGGIVVQCVNLFWGRVDVASKMKELTGIHTTVGNDANVAALGEAWMGGGKGCKDVVMVTLGTGVGGGIILNGSILTGTRGAAGELGHMLVNYDEEIHCNCGKTGCLEQYASATGIVKETKRLLASCDTPSALREVEDMTAKDVFDLAKAGDELASRSVQQLCRYLGIACSHVAEVIDPEVFVIGGGVSKAGVIITENVSRYYDQYVMSPMRGKEFRLAELGNDAGIYGSAKLALGK